MLGGNTLNGEQKAALREGREELLDEFRAVGFELSQRRDREQQQTNAPEQERAVIAESRGEGRAVEVMAEQGAGMALSGVADLAAKAIEGLAEFLSPTNWSREDLGRMADERERVNEIEQFNAKKYIEDREYRERFNKQEEERKEREGAEQHEQEKRRERDR